ARRTPMGVSRPGASPESCPTARPIAEGHHDRRLRQPWAPDMRHSELTPPRRGCLWNTSTRLPLADVQDQLTPEPYARSGSKLIARMPNGRTLWCLRCDSGCWSHTPHLGRVSVISHWAAAGPYIASVRQRNWSADLSARRRKRTDVSLGQFSSTF